MKTTLFIAVYEKELPKVMPEHEWHPWMHCDPDDQQMIRGLALNRHIRNRGGFMPEELPVRVFVCVRKTMDTPCAVDYTQFSIQPNGR